MKRFIAVAAVMLLVPSVSEGPGREGRERPSAVAGIRNILILGDSLAHGAGDETGRGIAGALAALTGAGVENLGINGGRTSELLRQLEREDVRRSVRRAQLIVVSIGGNDLFGNSLERLRSRVAPRVASWVVSRRVRRAIARIHAENPTAEIALLGLYDPYRETKLAPWIDTQIARWDARIIALFAGHRAVNVVRIADLVDERWAISPLDHYHPSARGYRAIAQRIRGAYTFSSG